MAKKIVSRTNRKKWYEAFKNIMTGRYKKPQFIYLGEGFKEGSIIISNHEGTESPMSLELYCDTPLRMWGAHEMNSGLVKLYKYQTNVYYHEKKHWNIHLARLFCLIASPLTNIFYKGLNLISTYKDTRFVKTLKESYKALTNNESVVIFPEDSKNGYLEQLEGFHCGVVMLGEYCYKKGLDLPIYVTYLKKNTLQYIVDKPIMYSELSFDCSTREQVAKKLLDRCNYLGRMEFDKEGNLLKKDDTVEVNAIA